jgi:signal transduction histidine kinase
MRWSSIRIRLTLWNGAIVAVLMIAFDLVLCFRVQAELGRSIDAGLAEAVWPLRVAPPLFPPPVPGPGVFGMIVGEPGRADRSTFARGPAPVAGAARRAPTARRAQARQPKGAAPPPPASQPPHGAQSVTSPALAITGMMAGESGQPPHGGIFGTAALAEDGLTPLPRFFMVTGGPLPDGGPGDAGADRSARLPAGNSAAWDPEGCAAAAAGSERYSTVKRAGTRMRVLSAPMRRRGKVVAVIQTAHSLGDQDRLTAVQASTLSIFVPVSVLVSALAGALLTGRALRPVRRLTQAADEIGASDLSLRLEVRGDDEFAQLSRTFNRMIARLGEAFGELERGYRHIEEAYARLQSAYERERRFTSDASHELGTPLAQMKACTSLALSAERSAASYRESLQMLDRCSDTMTQIVCDLLLLARGDAAQLGLDIEALSGADVAREAVNRVACGSGPCVRVQAPFDVEVRADREHLTRVLVNLLENAVRHTLAEGSVVLEVGCEGGDVIFSVKDTGEGIPPEHLPHVCERFYRVDAGRDRTRGGAGLGLAICQSIVSAHGGALEIESEVGRGTRVIVRLPQAPSSPVRGVRPG